MSSQGASRQDETIHLLNPQQRRDLDTLTRLVAAHLDAIYSDMDVISALRAANFDTAKAFLALKKRSEVNKKRSLLDDETWRLPKRGRMSLPANTSRYPRFLTPLDAAREADARNSMRIPASAPSRIESDVVDAYNVQYSQKYLEDENSQETLVSPSPPTQSNRREGDPTCAANLLTQNLSSRLNPFKEETEHSLEEVLEKLAVHWTSDVKNLLEQACTAHFNAATKKPSSFDATEASNLLLDILSLLPHVDHMDALEKRITPSEDDVHRSDQAAMAASLAALPKPEDKIKALNLACHGHITRLESYRKAKNELEVMHSTITFLLKEKLGHVSSLVQAGQANLSEKAAYLQQARTEEGEAAKKLQDLVMKRRTSFLEAGLHADAAMIRAQTVVFTSSDEIEAVAFREQHSTTERAVNTATEAWEAASKLDAFNIAVQMLLRSVVAIRQNSLDHAFQAFDKEHARAQAISTEQLKTLLPRLMDQLVSFEDALVQRMHHATDEAEAERLRLMTHDQLMGDSAPTRRKNIEDSITEFDNAVQLSRDLMEHTASEQMQLWTSLQEVVSPDVIEVLKNECGRHAMQVQGPMRQVFVHFAYASTTPATSSSSLSSLVIPEEVHGDANEDKPAALTGQNERQDAQVNDAAAVKDAASLGYAPTTTTGPTSPPLPSSQDDSMQSESTSSSKYKVGDVLYTRINETAFIPCRVLEEVTRDNKYKMLYEDGSIFSVPENHLFTYDEYQDVLAQVEIEDESAAVAASRCALM
ncbi:unnamed protein product [Aphanomyces euteiches]|uniref:Uncharacterized protein n=1 Tax=Aphanomyces euteiches TaxID=100861 RepID=A0A6G0WFA1_9STRA|nr:hypothetical protein Ae201684_016148 [Aphanomyces euteiches]KAH9156914.1 hypothetical protein AeRB84_001206 [Aphanomyces euteiches]